MSRVLQAQREPLLDFLETAVDAKQDEFRELLAASADLSRSKEDFASNMKTLTVLLEDLLYLAEGVAEASSISTSWTGLRTLAEQAGPDRLIQMAEFLRTIESSMKTHVNRQMLTDVLAVIGNETTSKIVNDNPRKSR